MDLYPAIDIRDGGAVRLTQGDFDRQSDYGDPVALAGRFASGGAPWLHVVDLDAARSGLPVNRGVVLAIARAVDVPVETGGGVRTVDDVAELLEGGIERVILGTAALDDPNLVRQVTNAYPHMIDGRAEVAIRGWQEGSGRTVGDLLDEVAGAGLAAVIVTSIERDGMLTGPDLDGLAAVLDSTDVPVIASGGVGSVAHIEALGALEVAVDGGLPRRLLGVITGKALVDGRMTVEEGMAACARFV
jgi:phosphoribosylformimino-5-aminoimidazole carboxamide ribotide isomerase